MKRISIVCPTFNEEENVDELYAQVNAVIGKMPQYEWEYIFIDNASTDRTADLLRKLAAGDPRVKVILNTRNFGPLRSPHYAVMQSTADAVITMCADLQDPPELIPQFVEKWESGYRIVLGQKVSSEESQVFYILRTAYYRVVRKLADVQLLDHVTGFGIYDRKVVDDFRRIDDPYPYGRGLICDLGYEAARIPYRQPERKRGISKHNFYSLYDIAMLGIVSHSKVPLRLATFLGFGMALLSLLVALGYLAYKLIFWDRFPVGQAPMVIGLFLFSSVQLFFTGMVGEYIGAIHTQVLNRPLVIEKERINF